MQNSAFKEYIEHDSDPSRERSDVLVKTKSVKAYKFLVPGVESNKAIVRFDYLPRALCRVVKGGAVTKKEPSKLIEFWKKVDEHNSADPQRTYHPIPSQHVAEFFSMPEAQNLVTPDFTRQGHLLILDLFSGEGNLSLPISASLNFSKSATIALDNNMARQDVHRGRFIEVYDKNHQLTTSNVNLSKVDLWTESG